MKRALRKMFCWQPTRDTLVAFGAGFVAIALSAAMVPARGTPWLSIAIRDAGQILLCGVIFPLAYLRWRDEDLRAFGFTLRRWYLFLPVSFILGAGLAAVFLSKMPPGSEFHPDWWKVSFVMLAGVFETIFFYGFLRTLFERAFGIVPGIVLSALFYAFHHMGFQPEYGKLIFVGLMYAVTYRAGNSALLIYPFFWGVGATYDVLFQSRVVSPILHAEIRTVYIGLTMAGVFAWTLLSSTRGRGYTLFTSLILGMLNREASAPKSRSGDIIEALHIGKGSTVADIGSGGGYFAALLAKEIGPEGTVIAADTRKDYLAFVENYVREQGIANVSCVALPGDHLELPQVKLDLLFLRNVFHHLPQPESYFEGLGRYLKLSAKIVIIEHRPKAGLGPVSLLGHHTDPEAIVKTMEKAGFPLSESFDFLPDQSFFVFAQGVNA